MYILYGDNAKCHNNWRFILTIGFKAHQTPQIDMYNPSHKFDAINSALTHWEKITSSPSLCIRTRCVIIGTR